MNFVVKPSPSKTVARKEIEIYTSTVYTLQLNNYFKIQMLKTVSLQRSSAKTNAHQQKPTLVSKNTNVHLDFTSVPIDKLTFKESFKNF